jgi:palmitoyltransferase ZDHHC13/17
LAILPKLHGSTCAILSDDLCATVSEDWYAVIISVWATLQLVWVAMLIIVQLLQIARGMTTYEAMTPHKHSHSQSNGQATTIVDAGDPSISAGPNNRGPDAAAGDTAGGHNHAHPHKKHGLLHAWKQLLGIDTFVEVALHGRGAPAQVGGSARSQLNRNPFSRGCVTNCKDFWLDEEGPWFGSRESGRATFSGQAVDYTSMYEVPVGGMAYAPVSSGDGEV